MKKFIFSILAFGGFLSSNLAIGQSFVPQNRNIKYTIYSAANIRAEISNNTSSDIQFDWKVIGNDFPADWKAGTAICDNVTCYNNGIFEGSAYQTNTFTGSMNLNVQLSNFDNVLPGAHHLAIEIRGGSTIDTIDFEVTKWATNVTKPAKSDNSITLYPNPARAELNVLFDANAGIKTLAVYNLIGKAVSAYRVSGNSAKLDIDNIPAGIYFIRFVDNSGRVVATRKFTHQ